MDRTKNLETSLVIVTGLLAIYLLKEWIILLYIAIFVGFIGIFLNKPASWISWAWYKIADLLGAVMSKVLLSLIYLVILVPTSILSRVFRRNKYNIIRRNQKSMWIIRDFLYSEDDLRNPW